MKIDFPPIPQSQDVQREAIDILIERMGLTKAIIFLGEQFWQPNDYLKTKSQFVSDQTLDELYQDILDWKQAKE